MAELVGLLASILQLVDTIVKASTYVKDFQDAPKEQQKLLSEVQSLQPLLQELQSRVRDNQTASGIQQLKDPLARFEETMKRFSDKLRAASGPWSKVSKQLTWTLWNKKEASEELNKIERFKSLVNAWLAIDLWDIAQTQQQNLDDLVQRVKDAFEEQKQEQDHLSALMSDTAHEHRQYVASAERDKVIEWLSPVNFFPRQADIFSTRQDGTGEWLFEDDRFKAWKSSFGGCLWCHGMPGAGKTVIAGRQ
ncbi:hypothetical protein B0H10DRAFT_1222751 [Mycena sp. CBHHK59/15]|nr:hypothetical protein B0H10DRAFT_1222751 [Mycena sp. CBHHK59/15]